MCMEAFSHVWVVFLFDKNKHSHCLSLPQLASAVFCSVIKMENMRHAAGCSSMKQHSPKWGRQHVLFIELFLEAGIPRHG